jgi:hypothetical protein
MIRFMTSKADHGVIGGDDSGTNATTQKKIVINRQRLPSDVMTNDDDEDPSCGR